jgi:hypothetical protein
VPGPGKPIFGPNN